MTREYLSLQRELVEEWLKRTVHVSWLRLQYKDL